MSQPAQLRIVLYTTIISMHVTNTLYMGWYRKQVQSDERAKTFQDMENRFLTIWNVTLQIAYAFFGLICDIFILKNSRKQSYSLPRFIAEFRETMFSAVVWPSTWLVFTIFWGLYNYDRSLIFPEWMDVIVPTISNHIIHTAIVPIVLFEVMFRPRIEPSSHLKNLAVTTLYIASYLFLMLFTYKERNVWLYPIFGQLYGSINFLLLLAGIYGLLIGFYIMQWPLSKLICVQGAEKRERRQIQKRKKRV